MTLIGTSANNTSSLVLTATTPSEGGRPLPEPTEFNVVQIDINKTGPDSKAIIVEPIKDQIQGFIGTHIPNAQ